MISAFKSSVRHITQVAFPGPKPQSRGHIRHKADGFDGASSSDSTIPKSVTFGAVPLRADRSNEIIRAVARKLRRTNGCDLNFSTIRALLQTIPRTAESMVWLGICERIRGANPVPILQPLLDHPKFGRLALVNLGAYYATTARQEKLHAISCIDLLSTHLERQPSDKFAALVKGLMLAKLNENQQSYSVLEDLYLKFPNYAPCTSAMAALLYFDGLLESAYDYAEESLRTRPDNVQALAVFRTRERFQREEDLMAQLHYLRKAYAGYEPESILFWNYDFLDPVQ